MADQSVMMTWDCDEVGGSGEELFGFDQVSAQLNLMVMDCYYVGIRNLVL